MYIKNATDAGTPRPTPPNPGEVEHVLCFQISVETDPQTGRQTTTYLDVRWA